jgi:type I restriction enzyme S subunit
VWSSQHVMKIVPDEARISSGYLFAFLSGKYGKAQIIAGTYGAIIQHIEPQHIANLSVPRVDKIELEVHKLVRRAAEKRSQAARLRTRALAMVEQQLNWTPATDRSLSFTALSRETIRRMDAFYHSIGITRARRRLSGTGPAGRLGSKVVRIFEPNRSPRMKVDDTAFGVPFLSSSDVFKVDPVGDYLISRRTPSFSDLLVEDKDILLPRSGQVGGIIGRAVLPLSTYYGCAATEHLIRVRCNDQNDAFYLWAVLASEPGYLAIVGTAYGSSIPSLDCELLAELQVPWFDERQRFQIAALVREMVGLLSSATQDERDAISQVDFGIEEMV